MRFIVAMFSVIFCASSGFAQETTLPDDIQFGGLNYSTILDAVNEWPTEDKILLTELMSTPIRDLKDQKLYHTVCDVNTCGSLSEERSYQILDMAIEDKSDQADWEHRDRNTSIATDGLDLAKASFCISILAAIFAFLGLVVSVAPHLKRNKAKTRTMRNKVVNSPLDEFKPEDTKGETK